MTPNFNVFFHFFEPKFPHICFKKVPIVSTQHFILSIPDYHHISFQWFSHFPILIPIFHGESFGLYQLHLILSCWCSIDLLMIFVFLSPLCTDPHEYFNSQTPAWLLSINSSVLLHKISFKLGSVWNATLNPHFSIYFLVFDPIWSTQRMATVCDVC